MQIFVNLPASEKWITPSVSYLAAPWVPVVCSDGGAVTRVLVGRSGGIESPLVPPIPSPSSTSRSLAMGSSSIPFVRTETAVAWVLGGTGALDVPFGGGF